MLDTIETGTVAQSLDGLRESARSVRDQLSGDTWMVLGATDRAIAELSDARGDGGMALASTQAAVLSGMLALSGLAGENMVRDPGWYFMDIGRRLERAQQVTALLRATLTRSHSSAVDSLVVESVLAASESGVTYRRRYRARIQVATMLELLLLDAGNPRSLAYQVAQARADLRALPDSSGTSRPQRRLEDVEGVAAPRPAGGTRPDRRRRPAARSCVDAARRAQRIPPRYRRCDCGAALLAPDARCRPLGVVTYDGVHVMIRRYRIEHVTRVHATRTRCRPRSAAATCTRGRCPVSGACGTA